MPRRRRRIVGKPTAEAAVTREEFEQLRGSFDNLLRSLSRGMAIRGVTSSDPLVDDSYEVYFDGPAVRADLAETVETITDGAAPASSPTPTVAGGPRYLTIKIPTVANADLVLYDVYIGATVGFTADATTLAATTPANLLYVRAVNGVDLAYDTDYYVKIIARDGDGSAAIGAEVGPTRLDPNGTDDFLAGSVTAEKLDVVLALTSALIAGTLGAQRVEVGFGTDALGALDPSFIGIRSFESDGTTVTFRVDAQTGQVYVKGRIDFGTASRLLADDKIELAQQPTGTYQEPSWIQSNGASSGSGSGSTASTSWDSPTTAGNELLMILGIRDADGAVPSPSTPAGWALEASSTTAGMGVFIYRCTSTTSRSGTESVTLNDTVNWVLNIFEFTGVQVLAADKTATASGTSTSPSTGATATTTQTDEQWFGAIYWQDVQSSVPLSGFNDLALDPAGWDLILTSDYWYNGAGRFSRNIGGVMVEQNVTSTGIAEGSGTLDASAPWVGAMVCLKAKLSEVDAAGADLLQIYAKQINSTPHPAVVDDNGRESAIVLATTSEGIYGHAIQTLIDDLNAAAQTLNTTAVTTDTLSVTLPSGWTSMDIVIHGKVTVVETGAAGDPCRASAWLDDGTTQIGQVSQVTIPVSGGNMGETAALHAIMTGLTADQTIRIRGLITAGAANGTMRFQERFLAVHKIRRS